VVHADPLEVHVELVGRPGDRLALEQRAGTQKECTTSADRSLMWIGTPTGTTISGTFPGP
jgi:hypothetical protein